MIYAGLNYQGETHLDYHCTLKIMKGRRENQVFSWGVYQWEGCVDIRKGEMRVNMMDVFCIHI
jgi:hypothetical protein